MAKQAEEVKPEAEVTPVAPEGWITVAQINEQFGYHPMYVRRLTREGKFGDYQTIGNKFYVNPEGVQAYADKQVARKSAQAEAKAEKEAAAAAKAEEKAELRAKQAQLAAEKAAAGTAEA